MQIVTLENLKLVLNITYSSQDARLTYLANIAESEVLDYCYLASMEDFYTAFGEDEAARGALIQAVLYLVDKRFRGEAVAVRSDPHLIRTLQRYHPPVVTA